MSTDLEQLLKEGLEAPRNIPVRQLTGMLSSTDPGVTNELFAAANELKRRYHKDAVLPRGLIECANICVKNCYYCGIRKDNHCLTRYRMREDEILDAVQKAVELKYPAIALQAGEIESEENTCFYERILSRLPAGLEVTLSLGEQTSEVYQRWQVAAGERVLRYLIRIETSDEKLYAKLHPANHSFVRRLKCIRDLKHLGYITGSGVMIGLPGQSFDSLANDIVFFGAENLDMVGMGPFVPAENTPLDKAAPSSLITSLKMIALTRLYMHDINIVSATALEALDPEKGRQLGIEAGANVVMPNLTPEKYCKDYRLYPNKPIKEKSL